MNIQIITRQRKLDRLYKEVEKKVDGPTMDLIRDLVELELELESESNI